LQILEAPVTELISLLALETLMLMLEVGKSSVTIKSGKNVNVRGGKETCMYGDGNGDGITETEL
jgi:hypothetical protein